MPHHGLAVGQHHGHIHADLIVVLGIIVLAGMKVGAGMAEEVFYTGGGEGGGGREGGRERSTIGRRVAGGECAEPNCEDFSLMPPRQPGYGGVILLVLVPAQGFPGVGVK